jgi:hypothetical protein
MAVLALVLAGFQWLIVAFADHGWLRVLTALLTTVVSPPILLRMGNRAVRPPK